MTKLTIEDAGLGDRDTVSMARRVEKIYAEAPVVSHGLGAGWVGKRSLGLGGANAVTAPVAIACKTDDNDMVLSFTSRGYCESPSVKG